MHEKDFDSTIIIIIINNNNNNNNAVVIITLFTCSGGDGWDAATWRGWDKLKRCETTENQFTGVKYMG